MRHFIAGLCVLVSAAPAGAQRKTIIGNNAIYRYLGDTIWMERDTTISRTVYRGDTVVRTTFMNDSLRGALTYVAEGSMARVVAVTGKDGKPAPLPNWSPVTIESLAIEIQALEMEVRMQNTRAQLDGYLSSNDPSPTSESLRTYASAPDLRILQFKDTVRYIRGCPNAARFDTTTFVLFGADSVKRVTPERVFGNAMAISVLGAMRLAAGRERTQARGPSLPDLPRPPKACGR